MCMYMNMYMCICIYVYVYVYLCVYVYVYVCTRTPEGHDPDMLMDTQLQSPRKREALVAGLAQTHVDALASRPVGRVKNGNPIGLQQAKRRQHDGALTPM